MVIRILAFLLTVICCFGQAYTLQDQSFIGNLMSGNTGIQGCGSFTSGLLRYWKIDEGSGTWIADYVTGNTNAASIINSSYAWSTDAPFLLESIRKPNSLRIYNFNNYVNCGSGATSTEFYIISGNYTVSAWLKHDTGVTVRNNEAAVEGRARGGQNAWHFTLGTLSASGGVYAFGDATLGTLFPGPTVASVGDNWCLWTATRVGSLWTLYKNAVSVATSVNSGQASVDTPCTIVIGGTFVGDGFSPRNWGGLVGDVRVYNRGLGSNDVWCLYHQYYGIN